MATRKARPHSRDTVVYDPETILCTCVCGRHLVARVRKDARQSVEFWARHSPPESMQRVNRCPACSRQFPELTRCELLELIAGRPAS